MEVASSHTWRTLTCLVISKYTRGAESMYHGGIYTFVFLLPSSSKLCTLWHKVAVPENFIMETVSGKWLLLKMPQGWRRKQDRVHHGLRLLAKGSRTEKAFVSLFLFTVLPNRPQVVGEVVSASASLSTVFSPSCECDAGMLRLWVDLFDQVVPPPPPLLPLCLSPFRLL